MTICQTALKYVYVPVVGVLILFMCQAVQAASMYQSPIINNINTDGFLSSFNINTQTNPLKHQLASGLNVKGIKIAESLFLTKQNSVCGHKRLALSLNYNDVLYQMGSDRISLTVRF